MSFCCYTVVIFPTCRMETSVADSFPASIEVDGFTVHKLKLSEYAQVFDKLQNIPSLLAPLSTSTNDQIMLAIPGIVAKSLPEVLAILAIAVRIPMEELDEKMDMKTAVRCMKAMFEVNDFLGVWEEIRPLVESVNPAKK